MRKRIIAGVLALTLVMGSVALPNDTVIGTVSQTGSAVYFDEYDEAKVNVDKNYKYEILSDDTASIVSYSGKDTKLTIPSTLGGKKVTEIQSEAFNYEDKLTDVIIPDTVETIGSNAFDSCDSLKNITISNNLTQLGHSAFDDTAWYENQADGVVYIGKVVYGYKGDMPKNTSIEIKDGTTLIADEAFDEQENLTAIKIPSSVKYIGCYAFDECSGLTSVDIPEGVQEIYSDAFYDCENLLTISIPKSVTYLGQGCFDDTAWYDAQADGLVYINNMLYTYNCKMPADTTIEIKEGTEKICGGAFVNCIGLTNVKLPSSLNYIGDGSFYGCSGLKAISIPNSVKEIDDYAFNGCVGLSEITIPESVTRIGTSAFYECSGLKSVNIMNGVKDIDMFAFNCCTGLTSITIPDSVNYISAGLLFGCTGLKSVKLSSNAKGIGMGALQGCKGLTEITIPDSVISLGMNTFSTCTGLKSVTIPKNVKNMDYSTFSGCTSLTEFKVASDNSTFSVEKGLLYNKKKTKLILCPTGKTSVSISSGITSIEESAFEDCSNIKSITIPNGVTSIGENAFKNCKGITSITIPNKVDSIGNSAFSNCTNLKSLKAPDLISDLGSNVFENTAWYKSKSNGVVYVGKVAYKYKGDTDKLKSVTIKKGTLRVNADCFYYCENLKTVNMPDSVISVGEDAFNYTKWYDAQANGVVYIGKVAYGFKGAVPKSKSIVIKDGTLGIADKAFSNFEESDERFVKSVTIPNTVKYVGYRAMYGCENLKSIVIPESVKTIKKQAFGYHFDSENTDNEYTVYSNFKISCVKGSAGEKYAKNNKISCTYLNSFSKSTAKLSKTLYTYSGKAIKPAVTVKYGKTTLKNGTDYTVTYKNNKSAGKASAVIKGKGKYTGTKTLTFSIRPKKQTTKLTAANNAFKVSWKKDTQATAYEIQYSAKSNFKGAKKVVAAKKLTSKSIKGKNKTKYYVRVRAYKTVSGKKIYGAWSTVKSVTTR